MAILVFDLLHDKFIREDVGAQAESSRVQVEVALLRRIVSATQGVRRLVPDDWLVRRRDNTVLGVTNELLVRDVGKNTAAIAFGGVAHVTR
jgi:hypothetical protein